MSTALKYTISFFTLAASATALLVGPPIPTAGASLPRCETADLDTDFVEKNVTSVFSLNDDCAALDNHRVVATITGRIRAEGQPDDADIWWGGEFTIGAQPFHLGNDGSNCPSCAGRSGQRGPRMVQFTTREFTLSKTTDVFSVDFGMANSTRSDDHKLQFVGRVHLQQL